MSTEVIAIKKISSVSLMLGFLTIAAMMFFVQPASAAEESDRLESISTQLGLVEKIVDLLSQVLGNEEVLGAADVAVPSDIDAAKARLVDAKKDLEGTVVEYRSLGTQITAKRADRSALITRLASTSVATDRTTLKAEIAAVGETLKALSDARTVASDSIAALRITIADLTALVKTLSVPVTSVPSSKAKISVVATEVKANAEAPDGKNYILDATIEFQVTAIDRDIYIPKKAARGTDKTAGINFRMHDAGIPAGAVLDGKAEVAFITLNADEEGEYFIVHEGETEEFDVNVWFEPSTPVAVGLTLLSLNWNTSPSAPNTFTKFEPSAKFMTEAVIVPPFDALGTYTGYLNGKMFIQTKNISESDALENCMVNATANPKSVIKCEWNKTVIYTSPAVPTGPLTGTYIGYMNGSKFIETKDTTEAKALTNCKLNADNNPKSSVRCTWGTKEIFKKDVATVYGIGDVQLVTQQKVNPIPYAFDDDYIEYTITLKSGVVHKVKYYGLLPPDVFDSAVRATGYQGDITALFKTAVTQVPMSLSIVKPAKNETLYRSTPYRVTWNSVGLGDAVVNVTLENQYAQDHLALYVPAKQGYADITIPTTGPAGTIKGAATLMVWVTMLPESDPRSKVEPSIAVVVAEQSSATTTGTYTGYLNGKKFIETKQITEADALKNCKLNADNNPKSSVRCTWGTKEIFKTSTVVKGIYALYANDTNIVDQAGVTKADALKRCKAYIKKNPEPQVTCTWEGKVIHEVPGTDPATDEAIFKTSDEDPDATTFVVDAEDESDWMTVFAFDIDSDDSVNDIEANSIVVKVESPSGESVYDMLDDARLIIDGETYDDFEVISETSSSMTLSFDMDGDLVIEAGESATAELELSFREQDGNYDNGDTIKASVLGTESEFEGADDFMGTGSVTGETHTLRTGGVIVEVADMTETVESSSSGKDNRGSFEIELDVTAFGQDVWVNSSGARGTAMGRGGVNYLITDGAGHAVEGQSTSATLSSSANKESDRFLIEEGETETFTLTILLYPYKSGFYAVQLYGVNYAASSANPTTQQKMVPASDFETDALLI